jgi:hypothetical protein
MLKSTICFRFLGSRVRKKKFEYKQRVESKCLKDNSLGENEKKFNFFSENLASDL